MKPETGRRMHLGMMMFWGIQMVAVPFLMPMDWRAYLLEISLYANFGTHWSGWSAERPSEVADAT
jgi:hypothetical protein